GLIGLAQTVQMWHPLENDLDLDFCGTWRHGRVSLRLAVDISTGCNGISISANRSTLSINGQMSAQCRWSDVIHLTDQFGFDSAEESNFCLHWEPLLDQLKLQLRGKNFTLCWPVSLQGSCCTDLSFGPNTPEAPYGITKGMVKNDVITDKILTAYNFNGTSINCSKGEWMLSVIVMGPQAVGLVEHPCARSTEVEMMDDFRGYNVTWPRTQGVSAESTVTVRIPTALKQAAKLTNKVVCTFFKNNSFFQESVKNVRILNDVVGITVENEIIINLPEPVRVDFYHDKTHSRTCVSWDTRKDPLQVNWLTEGCETRQYGPNHTECLCNHLTYFSVLVTLEPRPVCHLLALSVITSVGCAVSLISCVALIIYLCRKSKRSKEQRSIPIHFGLTVSLALLNLLFFFTGVLANVGGESVCAWVAAGLHYSLLASLTWMGIEVVHTFWLVYWVFCPTPKACVWNLVGFGESLPAVPVLILVAVGDIYGMRKVQQCHDRSDPYLMCWMKDSNKAWLAHYFINMTVLVIVVLSGLVMLFLVYRQIRTRDEWRQKRVAFLSIWGLSCLFGTTWGLTFLSSGPLSVFFIFLFCILNSFQGFFLMLRFCIVDWMQRHTSVSAPGSSSTGSTRQHMLQPQETS
uniref:Uncharacterized protein n=1 Tax=Mola mola TaxID=94237 RepID=A0A3Q3WY58_MOLML